MTLPHSSRWLMSFADLTLLLLAFFVLLHARADGQAAAASVRTAFGGETRAGLHLDLAADTLFEPGEAVLRPRAAAMIRGIGRRGAHVRAHVRIGVLGAAPGTSRFDAWELSAARAAALARAMGAGGIAPGSIDIDLPRGAGRPAPQHFLIESA